MTHTSTRSGSFERWPGLQDRWRAAIESAIVPTDSTLSERIAAARSLTESFLDDARTADPRTLRTVAARLAELRARPPADEV